MRILMKKTEKRKRRKEEVRKNKMVEEVKKKCKNLKDGRKIEN